ncbi:uncharacterized protein LOC130757444 [Actinidia eriantha]|uniref:uncharacterized protein LOC130757444 n=2 Tax=Actinidia eriantha TaxID=165200 RepID=UPI002587A68B|nr:uncharacterized protein LOC130757444 [Actinidia eriantha]
MLAPSHRGAPYPRPDCAAKYITLRVVVAPSLVPCANQGEIQTYDSYGFLASWCECDRIHPAIKENVDVVSFGNFIKVVSSANRSRILLWSLGKWCGDATNSFHFQFGEMTLTPLDFTMITSLEVGGMPLLFDSNMHLSKSTVDGCLGERFLVSVQYKEHVPYTAIYIGFSSFDYRTPWEVIDLTRAVPLCLLRTSIFANLEKIVPLGVYKLLEHSQAMRLFNWDGTLLATIYGYMGAILRNITNWIGGFYPVWEMWCHTYLNMFAPRNHFPHHGSFLRGQRWITEYMGKRTDGDFVSSVRGLLRTMIVKQINWNSQNIIQLPSHLRSMHQVNHQSRILIEGLYYMEGYLVERVVMRSLNFSAFRLPHPPPSMRHAFKLEGRMLEQVLEGDEVIAPIQDGDYQDNIRDFLMHPFNEDVPFPQANFAAAHLGVIKSSPGSSIQTELSEIGQTDADGTQFTHVFQPSKQGHVAQMFSSLTQQCVKMTNTMKNIIRKWELKLVQSCSSGAARDVAFDPSRAGGIRIKEPNFRGGEGPSQSRKLTSPQGFVALYYPVTKPRSKDKGVAKRGCK